MRLPGRLHRFHLRNQDTERFPAYLRYGQGAHADYFAKSKSAEQGYEDVKNAMHSDISKTTTCLRSLTANQTNQCVLNGETLFDSITENRPSIAFKYMYRTIFNEATAQRALSTMLFDSSFQYMETFGFHWSHATAIVSCAEQFCTSDVTAITKELEKALSLFKPQNKGGARSAGRHQKIDWSPMVKAYDGEAAFFPQDGFNVWVLEGNVSTFNHVNKVLPETAQIAPLL